MSFVLIIVRGLIQHSLFPVYVAEHFKHSNLSCLLCAILVINTSKCSAHLDDGCYEYGFCNVIVS